MSVNKKIGFGDNYPVAVNEVLPATPVDEPTEGRFTFDRNDITLDSMLRTFDKN